MSENEDGREEIQPVFARLTKMISYRYLESHHEYKTRFRGAAFRPKNDHDGADEAVQEDAGKVAVERGPIVFCAEGVDNAGNVLNLALPDDAELKPEFRKDLLRGVVVLSGKAMVQGAARKAARAKELDFLAFPYFAWANRGAGEMVVWLQRQLRSK